MKTLLTLVVDDSKVVPILRLIRHIGADQLDIRPIEEKLKALPKPEAGKPGRGAITQAVLAALADGPLFPVGVKQRLGEYTHHQVANTINRLARLKKIKKTKEGWKLNGS